MDETRKIPFWFPVAMAAMAGGMAWGIRGQYGHETGAMMAGLLVGLSLTWIFLPNAPWQSVVKTVALGTVAMGFGGSMTYGQTVGLTHDPNLVGHWDALRWGFLGLAVKGGIWIGFFGLFFSLGLSGDLYSWKRMLVFAGGLIVLYVVGLQLFNEPYHPATKELPRWYFSDDWRWEPGAELKPRREVWGGLLLALAGGTWYAGYWRHNGLVLRLTGWAVLGGAIGFPLGQSLQAWHAWNPTALDTGWLSKLHPHLNWWNWMETTFGATFGVVFGFGVWFHRHRIRLNPVEETSLDGLPARWAWVLLGCHLFLLSAVEFVSWRPVDAIYDLGLAMGWMPLVGIAGSRIWSHAVMFPILVLPIAGKTVRQLVYQEAVITPSLGWIIYFLLPMGLALAAAFLSYRGISRSTGEPPYNRWTLLYSTWLLFGLNFAFFHFPFPWREWTTRTPNAILFTLCAIGLSVGAYYIRNPVPILSGGCSSQKSQATPYA